MPRFLQSQKSAELLSSLKFFANDKPRIMKSASVRHRKKEAEQRETEFKGSKSLPRDRLPIPLRTKSFRKRKKKQSVQLGPSSSSPCLPELPFQRSASPRGPELQAPPSPHDSFGFEGSASPENVSDRRLRHDMGSPELSDSSPTNTSSIYNLGAPSCNISQSSIQSFCTKNESGKFDPAHGAGKRSYIETPIRRGSLRKTGLERPRVRTEEMDLPKRRPAVRDLFVNGPSSATEHISHRRGDSATQPQFPSELSRAPPHWQQPVFGIDEQREQISFDHGADEVQQVPLSWRLPQTHTNGISDLDPRAYLSSDNDVSSISDLGESATSSPVGQYWDTNRLLNASRPEVPVLAASKSFSTSSETPNEVCGYETPEITPRPLTKQEYVKQIWRNISRALRVGVEESKFIPDNRMRIPAGKVWRNQASNYFPPEARGMSQRSVVRIVQGHLKQLGMSRQAEGRQSETI